MRIIIKSFILILLCLLFAVAFYGLHFKSPPKLSLPGSLHTASMDWDGYTRSYVYYAPEKISANPALVFVFHGSLGDAEMSRSMYGYGFEQLAEDNGFIVIYPEGYKKHFNDCRKSGPYEANRLAIDDVGFMRALVAEFVQAHNANPREVFATGISNGGQMALRLALEAPDLVAAVASVAASLPAQDNMDCVPTDKSASVLVMNGTNDPMNPFHGGRVALYGLLGGRGEVISSIATVKYFAELAGHTQIPSIILLEDTVTDDNSTIEVTRWQDTDSETPRDSVALFRVVGGGHGAPHPDMKSPKILGGSNQDINAAEAIWAFFDDAR
jgi:polyhydroxybutyrate depolymerase